MDNLMMSGLLLLVAAAFFGFGIAFYRWLARRRASDRISVAEAEAARLVEQAREKAHQYRKRYLEEAEDGIRSKQEALDAEREEAKRAQRRARKKLDRRHQRINDRIRRVNKREALLQESDGVLERLQRGTDRARKHADKLRSRVQGLLDEANARNKELRSERRELAEREAATSALQDELRVLIDEHTRRLETVSGLTAQEARQHLVKRFEDEARLDASATVKAIRDEARLTAGREARKAVLTAIQRTASTHTIENTVSVVNLKSDDVKGRIIGREGRNIRAFETATGIEVIVDDTPEAVILSGFDPVRREIARIALGRLIQDGRIHPGRIEKVVRNVTSNIEEEIVETGERAVIELQLHGVHPELIRMVGRMRYRTSYGQNLLAHSLEVARIASLLAAEVGADPAIARRGGLLHDIGKVVEEPIDKPHAIAGMELCRRYKEADEVCNAVGAHHDEIEMTSLISPIVQASDAISGARPGARREALQAYIKRLEQLEELASSFDGVERVFAIQAGREIRVMVNSDRVSDGAAEELAVNISRRIESEVRYPGQVKVTVIREVRSIAVAK